MAKVDQPRIPKGFVGAGRFMKVGQALIAVAKDVSNPGDGGGRKRGTPKLAKAGGKLSAPKAVAPPKPKQSAGRGVDNRVRLQAASAVSDLASEIEELDENEADLDVLKRRVDATVRRYAGKPGEAELTELAARIHTAGTTTEMREIARERAQALGLDRIGGAGEVVVFDPKLHQALPGVTHQPGERVFVVRPGHVVDDDTPLTRMVYGEPRVTLRKAVVAEPPPVEAPPELAASPWAGVPDWADDPEANAAVAARKTHRADMAERLKTGVKPGEVTGPRALAAVPSGLHTAGALTRMTKDQRDFLRQYRGTAFPNINGALRRERGDLPGHFGFDFHREAVGHLDAVMERSKLQSDVVVHRGVMDGREVFGAAWDRDMTGGEWTEHAYVSTSADPAVVLDERFFTPDGGAVLRIRAPKGTGAAALSDGTYESEILLQRGLKMKVLSDTGPGPDRVIEVGIIHDKPRRSGAAGARGPAAGDGTPGDGLPGRGDIPGQPRARATEVAAPRLAKAGASLAAATPEEHAQALRSMKTREQARAYLAGIRGQELDALARYYSVQYKRSAGARRIAIVESSVGGRVDSEAIARSRLTYSEDEAATARRALPKRASLATAGVKLAPSLNEVAAQLGTATSREQAHQMLAGLSVAQLRQLAAQLGITVASRDNKSALRNVIVGIAVGRRLDSLAINPGRRPT